MTQSVRMDALSGHARSSSGKLPSDEAYRKSTWWVRIVFRWPRAAFGPAGETRAGELPAQTLGQLTALVGTAIRRRENRPDLRPGAGARNLATASLPLARLRGRAVAGSMVAAGPRPRTGQCS